MKGIISYEHSKSIISEEYRKIRTSIQYSNLDKKIKTILITSTIKNEGKSTTAANLAVQFAGVDNKKVLLLDCDLRNPSVHKHFGVSNMNGLTDLLVEEKNITEYLKKTEIDNLQILPSGYIPPNPAEMLASNKVKMLIEELKEHYDYIFIDTPPVGIVTDAGILASFIDATVLVVKSEEVDMNRLQDTKKKLDEVNANLIGAVLNAYKIKKDDYYYYSYYGSK